MRQRFNIFSQHLLQFSNRFYSAHAHSQHEDFVHPLIFLSSTDYDFSSPERTESRQRAQKHEQLFFSDCLQGKWNENFTHIFKGSSLDQRFLIASHKFQAVLWSNDLYLRSDEHQHQSSPKSCRSDMRSHILVVFLGRKVHVCTMISLSPFSHF